MTPGFFQEATREAMSAGELLGLSQPSSLTQVAFLLGERAGAEMLLALMTGRALTAKELAYPAGITPQTASETLGKLVRAEILALTRQGQFHYFRLASPAIANLIESMRTVAPWSSRKPAGLPSRNDSASR